MAKKIDKSDDYNTYIAINDDDEMNTYIFKSNILTDNGNSNINGTEFSRIICENLGVESEKDFTIYRLADPVKIETEMSVISVDSPPMLGEFIHG